MLSYGMCSVLIITHHITWIMSPLLIFYSRDAMRVEIRVKVFISGKYSFKSFIFYVAETLIEEV